jgi:hypothetical protein
MERTASGDEVLRVSLGKTRRLTSPEISVLPDGAHTLLLTASLDTEGEARLLFSSSLHEELDGSAAMVFHMKGDSAPHMYRIDVGLLPAWVWRGTVTRLQFEFPMGAEAVGIQSIQLRAYRPDGPAAGPASSAGFSHAAEREVSGGGDDLPTQTQSP